jgi:hypothetical protein
MQRTSVLAGLYNKEVLAPLLFQGSCNTELFVTWIALSPRPHKFISSCNTELFVTWIAEQLVPSLKVRQTVVMDNASIHKSPYVRHLIEKARCKLIYLPSYSPDLNPIETFWENMQMDQRKIQIL